MMCYKVKSVSSSALNVLSENGPQRSYIKRIWCKLIKSEGVPYSFCLVLIRGTAFK